MSSYKGVACQTLSLTSLLGTRRSSTNPRSSSALGFGFESTSFSGKPGSGRPIHLGSDTRDHHEAKTLCCWWDFKGIFYFGILSGTSIATRTLPSSEDTIRLERPNTTNYADVSTTKTFPEPSVNKNRNPGDASWIHGLP